jgi:hypothetical protein
MKKKTKKLTLKEELVLIAQSIAWTSLLMVAVVSLNTRYTKYSLNRDQGQLIMAAMERIENHPVLGSKYSDELSSLNEVAIVLVSDKDDISHGWIYDAVPDKVYVNRFWIISRNHAINVIAHEITHLLQVRYYGEKEFRKLYSEFYEEIGYWDNPLEIEARATESIIGIRINNRQTAIEADSELRLRVVHP